MKTSPSTFGNVGGPIPPQVTLRSFLRSPGPRGAENDPRVTWDTMAPPKAPKVQPGILVDGDREIVDESTWRHGRRSRAMTKNALEINKKSRVGTLRFSLWKPSPSALWFFSVKSWWLAGAGLVARGRHLMVPELSSGAPGPPCAAIDFFSNCLLYPSPSPRDRG